MVGTSDTAAPPGPLETRALLLRAIADPTRLAVLDALAERPSCHCELEEDLGVSSSRMSFHLKVLRDAGLVTTHRRGRLVEYQLDDRAVGELVVALPAPSSASASEPLGAASSTAPGSAVR